MKISRAEELLTAFYKTDPLDVRAKQAVDFLYVALFLVINEYPLLSEDEELEYVKGYTDAIHEIIRKLDKFFGRENK